jgi:hypothetical protein
LGQEEHKAGAVSTSQGEIPLVLANCLFGEILPSSSPPPRLHRLGAEIHRLPSCLTTTISAARLLLAVLPMRSPTMTMPKSFYMGE